MTLATWHAPAESAPKPWAAFTGLFTLMALALALFLAAPPAQAQDAKHEAQIRTVHGVTTDKSDNPIPTAIVFLKNVHNNAVRSCIADEQGNYRFSGLDPNVDYEVHAEKDSAKSPTRTVSSFDSRKDIVLNLKLDKHKA
jgi:hypothetical protein